MQLLLVAHEYVHIRETNILILAVTLSLALPTLLQYYIVAPIKIFIQFLDATLFSVESLDTGN